MPNFEDQTTGSRKDDFEKAETSLEEIKKTQVGDLSLEELQALVAKRQELSGEKETIVEADHEEALGMEEGRNAAIAEAAQVEQARQEAARHAEEKAAAEAADAARAEALLAQIKSGEAPQAEAVEGSTISNQEPIEERLEAPRTPMFEKYGNTMRQAAGELVKVMKAMDENQEAINSAQYGTPEAKQLWDEQQALNDERNRLLDNVTGGNRVIEFENKSSVWSEQNKYESSEVRKYKAAAMSDPKTVMLLAEAGQLALDYRSREIGESLSSNAEFMAKLLKSLPNRNAAQYFWASCTGEARKSRELYIAAVQKNHLNYQFGPKEWTTDSKIQEIAIESGLSPMYLQK